MTVASFGYDTEGRLHTVRGPGDGQPLRFEYDAEGRLTRWVDRIGAWYCYRYDRDGRCVAGRGIGHALDVSLEFDPLRRTTRETTADGATLAQGFSILNTPAQLGANQAAKTSDPVSIYNAYRTGVGYSDLLTVQPMRVIEIGLKFRF